MDKTKLEKKIRGELKETAERITELEELTQPISPENAIGRVSRMDAINNKSVNERTLRQMQSKLSKLQLALERLPEPNFGSCSRCGGQIQEGRLMLMPESNFCIRCAH